MAAFCAVTEKNIEDITFLVYTRIRQNPERLKSFKQFSQDIVNELLGKGLATEKALALASYLPQIVSDFNADKDNRRLLKSSEVSMDAIVNAEDSFDDYSKLARYLEIKNESQPLVVVNENQLKIDKQIGDHVLANKVEFEGDNRIINGKKYTTRVTSIAKVGFDDNFNTDDVQSPALKHGNTVDTIAKAIFDGINPKSSDFANLIDPTAFDGLVAKLKQAKSDMEQQGYIFRTSVTVFNKKLGISGEIDLVAISPKGEAQILDFKTANQRLNESYLKNDTLTFKSDNIRENVGILSKWKQYATQGGIYAIMLHESLGIPVSNKIGILGINLMYDEGISSSDSKIQRVGDVTLHNIPISDMRADLKATTVQEIYDKYKKLEAEALGSSEELKPLAKTRKNQSRKNFDNIGPETPLDRLASINEVAATDEQLAQEIKWFTSNLIGKDTLLRLDNIVNSGLFGNFTLDGITLYKNASQGTVYHEGWHRFSQVFMSRSEKNDLYKSVQDDNLKLHTRDGRRLLSKDASFLDVEEFLAEEFTKFAVNPEAYSYPTSNDKPKGIFQKILDFLKRFFGVNPRPIELFQKLYRGKVAEYVPSVNNAYWGNLNSMVTNGRGDEIVSNERFPLYKESFEAILGEQLAKYNKSFTAFKQSKVLQSKVLNNVFAVFKDKYQNDPNLTDQQVDELANILEDTYYFTNAALTATSFKTLKDFDVEESVFTMSTDEISAMDDIRDAYDDVEDIDDDANEDSRPERFDRTGNEDSAYSLSDDAIQDFFRTIPKVKSVNPDGSFVYDLNELGFKRNHTYFDVFYKTKKMLSGAFVMQDMLDRMASKNNQRIFPELKIVNDSFLGLLNNPNEKNHYRNVQNAQFIQSFYHVMVMPEVPNMQLTMNFLPITRPSKTFTPFTVSFRTASRNLSLKIIKGWEKDFKDRRNKTPVSFDNLDQQKAKLLENPLYVTDDGKVLLNPFADYQSLYPNTLKGLQDFFKTLGVNFNEKAYQDAESVNQLKKYKASLIKNINIYGAAKSTQYLADADTILEAENVSTADLIDLKTYTQKLDNIAINELNKLYFIENPISTFNDKQKYFTQSLVKGKVVSGEQTTDPLRFVFEDMAEIEEKFGDRVSSGGYRIEDKIKYPYYIPSQILTTSALINEVDNIGDFNNQQYLNNINPIKNKWMNRSVFFKGMFDQNGERNIDINGKPVRIVVEDIASVRNVSEDQNGKYSITERHPRSLNVNEKFFMDALSLFKAGALEVPRAETSSTMFSIRLSDYGNGKLQPISLADVLGKDVPEIFHEIVKDYFAGEVEKRQWYMKNEPTSKFAGMFNVFQGILSDDLRKEAEASLDKTPEQIFLQKDFLSKFRSEIEKYFGDRVTEILPLFDDPKIGLSKDQKTMLKDTVQSKNLQSLRSVAKAFIFNQFILSTEFYNLYAGDLYFYKNPFKRGKIVTNTGNTFFIDTHRNQLLNGIQNETLNSIYTGQKAGGKDFSKIKTSIIADVEMQSAYTSPNDSENIILNDIINMRVASGALVRGTSEFVAKMQEIKDSLAKYNKINIADGQGIIGMDFYRNFSIITNIWSETKEKEYERQKAVFRNHYNLYSKLDNEGNKIDLDEDELAEAKERDNSLISQKAFDFFNPLKISYTGPQAQDGPIHPVFDKFSVRPIIPEAALGRRDENMLLEMVKNDIDYIKFQSGSKVYQDSTSNWFKQIGDGKYDLTDFTPEELKPNELYAAYLKHQLSTEGLKTENILGSQFRKIVFGIKYSDLVKNNPQLVAHFSKLEDQFMDSIKNLLELNQSDLFSLLGIKETNGVYRVNDMRKFLKLLNDESVKRGVAINNTDYIQYDEATRDAKYPIDYAFNRQQIQDLLAGLIDDKLRRLKVNGTSLIQVSSAGFENKSGFANATLDDIKKYGTTGLHYYHVVYDDNGTPTRTSTMGVKVALNGDFKKLLNLDAPKSVDRYEGRIKTLDRLNKAMQDTDWKEKNKSLFEMVGYRIPTQNNNFIDHMEIMEFLPESAGAIIIPPIELIIKSGSDFDIDKMNVIKPALNSNGLISEPKESLSEIYDNIRNLTIDNPKEAKKELQKILERGRNEIDDLQNLQRKIRYTILDLAVKTGASESLIDNIMDNIQNNKAVIVPEISVPEEQAFPDAEDKNQDMDLFKATLDFVKVDNEIDKMVRGHELIDKEYKKIDTTWIDKKRQYKDAQNNKMLTTLAQTLSHPYYYELLVTPSSASMFEDYTNKLMASKANMTPEEFKQALDETDGKLFDKTNTPEYNNRYQATREAFDNLLSKRKDLGGWAIQRTFADIFNYVNFSIAKSYSVKDTTKIIQLPLVAPEDRSKLVENGRIKMHGDSVSGVPIKDSFDELISLTVDLAGSPAYPKMDINTYNRKHVQYLLHQGTDPESVLWFVNQPVLRELYDLLDERRRKMNGYTLKHGITELALRLRILENPRKENSSALKYEVRASEWVMFDEDKAEEEGKKGERVFSSRNANNYLTRPYLDLHNQNISEADYFSMDKMDKDIRDNTRNSDLQKKVLAYFGSVVDEADAFTAVQFANNVDTTKYSTLTSISRNRESRRKVRQSGLFDPRQLEKLEKDSMIAPFDYTSKAYEIQKTLFPKLYTNKTISTFKDLVSDIFGAKNAEVERISKIIENDYIEFVFKNYGTYEGKNLSDYFEPQLINTDSAQNHPYFSYRFLDIKNKYPELSDIPFVANLGEDIYNPPMDPIEDSYRGLDNKEIHNLFFQRNPENPTFEKNIYTTNWRNLINFDPQKLGLEKSYTQDQVKEIAGFFHELVYFSLYQSGLTNNSNGFSDLIPYEHWGSFIQSAFKAMDDAIEQNDSLQTELLRVFEIRVKEMNPKINWQKKYITLDIQDENGNDLRKPIDFYKNYHRGKDYKVTDDDLGFVRSAVLYDENQLADDQKIPTPDVQHNKFPLQTGRYVEYDGNIYIVTKSLTKPKIWQIYNPLKQGSAAKLSVHERNLIAREEMGSIVQYGQKQYLVTSKNEIIDLDGNKRVTWKTNDANRLKIVELAKSQKGLNQSGDNTITPPDLPPVDPIC